MPTSTIVAIMLLENTATVTNQTLKAPLYRIGSKRGIYSHYKAAAVVKEKILWKERTVLLWVASRRKGKAWKTSWKKSTRRTTSVSDVTVVCLLVITP